MAILNNNELVNEKKKSEYMSKYPNSLRVSYSKNMYLRIRDIAKRMGVSIHDLQRSAMSHYIPIAESEINATKIQKPE